MNLSKNELLKMAINSKPKKEILEKKSKNELIEYVFGVKVNECSMKKINQSEKHLEKCSSIPLDFRENRLEKCSSIPFDFRNSSYIPPPQQLSSPQYNLPYASPSNDFQKFLPTIMSSIETIKQWNEQEKPNALKLLEDGKNIVSEWINIQRPFFENKLEIVEKIWTNWERVDKPNMEKLLSEIRDTRSVIQNVDMTLVNSVNQKVTDYLQVQKPNIESKYNETSIQLRQFAQVTEQVRNENIKLLQLLGPIEELRSLFQNVTSFEEFKKSFEKQIQDLKTNYEQQLSLSVGNELTQIGEVSLQLSQTEQTISTLESDIIFLKSVFDELKEQSEKSIDSLNEQNLQFKNSLQILDTKISKVANSVIQRDEQQWTEALSDIIFLKSVFDELKEQSKKSNDSLNEQNLQFKNSLQILDTKISKVANSVIQRDDEQQWTEAFQNFLSEQRIRDDQQTLQFENRMLQIENQQNLEVANVVTENQVNTTPADNEFFQSMIAQFRQQWTEAFQNFLSEQRIRQLSYDQQFENRMLQIENRQNLEAITVDGIVPENRVNTTTADNEFFQSMIAQFRQQWTEAFQNFLSEQRIRQLSYDQQSLQFENRIQQLQIENRKNLEAITAINEIVPLGENQQNLEAITASRNDGIVPLGENRVNTTIADNEFFQSMIDQFRQQWTEAFQNFLSEQRIRQLSYDQQSLQFENRIQQLQIENRQNLEAITAINEIVPLGENRQNLEAITVDGIVPLGENRVNTTTADNEFFQSMIDEFRQQWTEAFQNFLSEQRGLQNDSETKIRNLTRMQISNFRQLNRNIETIREELPAIALPYKSPLAIESTPVKNLENAIQESNTQISIVSDTVSELRSDNRKMNVSLSQISKDVDTMQRTNVNLIEAAVNRKLIDDQEFNREQIKSVVQQELNNSLPIKNAASTNINEIVKQEILKQKDLIRQIVIKVVASEKKNVLSQISKSPVNFRIQQRFDKLREENSRLQNIITSISSRLESVSSRLAKVEEPPGKKRKIPALVPLRPTVIVPQRQSVIVPKLPAQF
jgi:hypothetical protein